MKKNFILLFVAFVFTACSLAPSYQRPRMVLPAHYKEAGKWQRAKTAVAELNRGPWWKLYHDKTLNQLETQVSVANQNLKVAIARYQEARALALITRSALYPTIIGVANAGRQQTSGNVANTASDRLYNDFLAAGDFSYEIDVWGRVRNAVAASVDQARASRADLASIDLSLHAELANDYFALRGDDAAVHVLNRTVTAYRKALQLTQQRHQGGVVSEMDVDQAQSQLENAKTALTDTLLKRAQLEHAIAVLIGVAPGNFNLAPRVAEIKWVTLSSDLPSTLLERRPDIAAAERRVEGANAEIGVARAAFYPDFNLISAAGFESATLAHLFTMPSLFWALGSASALTLVQPAMTITLFDGGKLQGQLDRANAIYYETVATYRQTTLNAFQEVEDNLIAIHRLDQETQTQIAATLAANRALTQARDRYVGGVTTYLDVVFSENIALQSELNLVDIKTRRQIASVLLIKALGGGWQSCERE